jgi:hypothetical protein
MLLIPRQDHQQGDLLQDPLLDHSKRETLHHDAQVRHDPNPKHPLDLLDLLPKHSGHLEKMLLLHQHNLLVERLIEGHFVVQANDLMIREKHIQQEVDLKNNSYYIW